MAATSTDGLTTFDPNLPGFGVTIVPFITGATIGDIGGVVTTRKSLQPTIPGPRQGYG